MFLLFKVSLMILLKRSICWTNFNDAEKHVDKNEEGSNEPRWLYSMSWSMFYSYLGMLLIFCLRILPPFLKFKLCAIRF